MSANAALSILLLLVVVAAIAWFAMAMTRYLPGEVQGPAKMLIAVLAIVVVIWRLLPMLP